MNIDILHLSLAGFVVGFVFKDNLVALCKKVRFKLFKSKFKMELELYRRLQDMGGVNQHHHQKTWGELDHIKGQLQESLQCLKTPKQMETDPLLITLNRDIQQIIRRMDEANNEAAAIKETLSAGLQNMETQQAATISEVVATRAVMAEPKQPESSGAEIYLKALATLAQGQEKVLERQEKNEKLLIQLVGTLNKLTQSD